MSAAGGGSTAGAKHDKHDYLLKVLTIGDSTVGKSSLLLRYSTNRFASNYIATIGLDFKTKDITLDESKVRLQVSMLPWRARTTGARLFFCVNCPCCVAHRFGEVVVVIYFFLMAHCPSSFSLHAPGTRLPQYALLASRCAFPAAHTHTTHATRTRSSALPALGHCWAGALPHHCCGVL
jgi:hypothetical protein